MCACATSAAEKLDEEESKSTSLPGLCVPDVNEFGSDSSAAGEREENK